MIVVKHIRDGFDQYHFNMDSDEPWPGIYPVLHHIWTPDGPQLHDHPHDIEAWVRKGRALEEDEWGRIVERKKGDTYFISAETKHRLFDVDDYWSMCFYGPTRHNWRLFVKA